MNNLDKSKYYIDTLNSAYSAEYADSRNYYFALYSILSELLSDVTSIEKQVFTSDFSKVEFIIHKYALKDDTENGLRSIRYYTSKFRKNRSSKCEQNEINLLAKVIVDLSFSVFGVISDPFAESVLKLFSRTIPYQKQRDSKTIRQDFINCQITDKYDEIASDETTKYYVVVKTDNNDEIIISLSRSWEYLYPIFESGQELNIFAVEAIESDLFTTSKNALIVLEPDIMLDVTELASCFSDKDFNYITYFIDLFGLSELSSKMYIGNIVNFIFDELIVDATQDYDSIYEKAIKSKPLSLFALSRKNNKELRNELAKLPNHYANLTSILRDIDLSKASIEPSFVSAQYGIQGRLDLLLENEAVPSQKDVIELKSGKAPTITKTALLGKPPKPVPIGMWYNNFAQITCYNMLLDSAYKNRTGNSAILYSAVVTDSYRNAVNSQYTKWQIVHLRNQIVAEILALANGSSRVIDYILNGDIQGLAIFTMNRLNNFRLSFATATEIEKIYFKKFLIFIQREIISAQLGDRTKTNNSFSSLWKKSIEEKENTYSLISNLELDSANSDFQKYHLFFRRAADTSGTSSFRNGDIVILYPYFEELISPINDQLIKCTIKEIDPEHIILSLRNKLFPIDIFKKEYAYWIIEPDRNDSNNKKLFGNLYEFLNANNYKRNVLLGQQEPKFDESLSIPDYPLLNANQQKILNLALRSQDYFLIQGPPGTGKTSFMLSHIIKYKIEHTEENLFLMAYTNRAVDEICEVLIKLGEGFEFIRLGNRESSVHQNNLICNIIEQEDIRVLYKRIGNIRVFVSTVFSAINNPEIFHLKNFHTAIIDEAAQILEPHIIGIVSKIPKFIMIGDEKQLPAIVTQNSEFLIVEDEQLQKIELHNLGSSLFERLLRICIQNNWTNNFGILTKQARMHKEIQEFSNRFFYNNELSILNEDSWQNEPFSLFSLSASDDIINSISRHRLVFINSKPEILNKVNQSEAQIIAEIVNEYFKDLGNKFEANTIGIISPFRAQCTEIGNRLSKEIRELVNIDTVERFQGSERRIIIYSLATNHKSLLNNICSMTEINGIIIDRKLNVALTRAKEQIIITGNIDILSENAIFRELIDFIKRNGLYIDLNV